MKVPIPCQDRWTWRLFLPILLGLLGLLLVTTPAFAGGPDLGGSGGTVAIYNPVDGYIYLLNSNDSISVIDGDRLVATIDLPGGAYSRLTDLAAAPNGDVYVTQWFYDRAIVLRNLQIYAIVPRQDDYLPGAMGIENGPLVVAADPFNQLVYVATAWSGELQNNGVSVISGTQVIANIPTGSYPDAVLPDPATGYVFVANALSNTVTVLDGTAIVKQISVGQYPAALGVDAVHGRVYVANRSSGTVSVIDESTLTVIATLPSGLGPLALAVDSQAGLAYVANHDSDDLSVIDGQTLTRLAVIPVGDNPLAVAQDPATGLVYVANQLSNTVSVIQGTSLSATLPVGRSPVALAWDPQEGLYVVNYQDASLTLIAGTDVLTTLSGLPRLAYTSFAPLPDGHTVVADLSGLETWFLNGSQVITHVQTLDNAYPQWDNPARAPLNEHLKVSHQAVAVDDLGRVFVASHEQEAVSVIDEGQGRTQTLWAYGAPWNLAALPGSGRVYASVSQGVVIFEGSPTVTATLWADARLEGAYLLASWPDRGYMYVARNLPDGSGQVVVLDDTSHTILAMIDVCDGPAEMAVDRLRGLVYVTCGGGNAVAVIADTTLLGEVPVGQFPQGIVINPLNGYAYVAAMLADQVAVLDGMSLVATFPVPALPIDLAVDPLSGRVFVACEGDDAIAVIQDTALLAVVPTGAFPDQVYFQSGSGMVYVGDAHLAALDIFQFAEAPPDPGNEWPQASPIISATAYAAPIQSEDDVDWYKINLDQPGALITITLGGLPLDYDLAFFNALTATAQTTSSLETLDLAQVLGDGSLGSLSSWVDLSQLRSLPSGQGGARRLGANGQLSPEVIADKIWEAGDYYIAVWGYNGAHALQPYVLRVDVVPPAVPLPPALPIPLTSVPPAFNASVRTLIVTNLESMRDRYGITQTASLSTSLATLAGSVDGTIVDLAGHADAAAAYTQWAAQRENPLAANYASDVIRAILQGMLTVSYPNAEYIVLVGNDNIVPFRRVPDLTLIANERGYNAWVEGDSPMAARVRSGYILTDNFYASYSPLPMRGHALYIPQYAIGRLVETPAEINAAIQAYLEVATVRPVSAALVTGYDFLTDEASAIAQDVQETGITVTRLISDSWSAAQLRPLLLAAPYDLISLNGHFSHQLLVAGDNVTYITRTAIVSATADYQNDLVYSIGCQSGLNVPDEDALAGETALALDFAQAFAGRGAAYIANTGYGYGDSDSIGYSESLALKFTQQLLGGPLPVGKALVQAKQDYFASVGYASFGDYDEKALIEWTLYGLPMLEVQLSPSQADQSPAGNPFYQAGSPLSGTGGYATLPVAVSPLFTAMTSTRLLNGTPVVIGNYYQVGDEIQVSPGRPLQPRLSVDLQSALPAGQVAHGALFTGGTYTDLEGFNPVVSRVVSDSAQIEPSFAFDRWYPLPMQVVNRLQFASALVSEKLVVIPAQYLAATAITGTERLYDSLNYEVLYTPLGATADFTPPAIQSVSVITTTQAAHFDVLVSDDSPVDRVVVACDDGQGAWSTFDLAPSGNGHWVGESSERLAQCFVQAVDQSGNVRLSDNKGIYFTAVGLELSAGATVGARPGETIIFEHTLANTGSGSDTYRLTFEVSQGWLVDFPPTSLSLAPGEQTTIPITVTVPGTASGGVVHTITMEVTSLSDPAASASATDTTRVAYLVYLPQISRRR